LPDAQASTADGSLDSSHASLQKRQERRVQVRERIEDTLDEPLQEAGPDYILPDGRRVAIYYSKIRSDGSTFLGIKNRIKNDDIIVLLLGDEDDPKHLVFPRAEILLRHRECFRPVGGDRIVPSIRAVSESFTLSRPSKGLSIPLDGRIDAYHELLHLPGQDRLRPNQVGRKFVQDDEDAVPRAAVPGSPDPDLMWRGSRAHKRTRNALAAYLKSLGLQPLDPEPYDPPFDLAWWNGGALYVAEIKSITKENEEHQLRLGLGQLLRYCQLLRKRVQVIVPVLVPELKPRDPEWSELCKELNIRLAFPPEFDNLTSYTVKV
jgi:hypothetical protein